jgi:SAM-dependent methyltransferase
MELYRTFADHYDHIFPTDGTTVAFLAASFGKGRVLDLGCATGGHVLALRERGFRADGIDLDPDMIRIAKAKAGAVGSPAMFGVADIRSLSAVDVYRGVFCIGNTLVHLCDEREIATMIRRMFFALAAGGTVVIQIVNYDRILDAGIAELPTIRNAGRTFERRYRRTEGGILFATVLTCGRERFEAATPLYPLRAAALRRMMEDAGFRGIVLSGGFDGRAFDAATSFATVAKGVKP